ncbi:MAG TPA: hypothetical protein VKT32_07050 [Chthonomonadaceae bacterium]|nr:hypothetical protein [Chthonomonadaceae bacterium]
MKTPTGPQALPDWWQRESQRRQNRVLLLLVLLLALIGFYYYVSSLGVTGTVQGVNFDTSDYIAFVRQEKDGGSGIYVVRADGTGLRRLTDPNDKSVKRDPAWAADGKSLIYSSNRTDSKFRQLYILGEGEPRQLTFGKSNKDDPQVSPDGKQVAFLQQGAVKTVNINGTDPYQVMPVPRSGNEGNGETDVGATVDPQSPFLSDSFASDSRGIAGVQELGGEAPAIPLGGATIEPGNQIGRALPSGASNAYILDTGREVSLAWEPNGQRLASAFDEAQVNDPTHGSQTISGIRIWSWKTPARPPTPQNIMVALGLSVEPKHIAWSPDGKKLAFEAWQLKPSGERAPIGIMVMDIPPQPLAIRPQDIPMVAQHCLIPATPQAQPENPRWSPDGERLLYDVTRPDGGHDVWVIDKEGANPLNLTKGVGDNIMAVWSPARH